MSKYSHYSSELKRKDPTLKHEYYHTDEGGVTDVQKMRDEANARALGTGYFKGKPGESSVIHMHMFNTDCTDQKHEYYRKGTGLVKPEGEAPKHD